MNNVLPLSRVATIDDYNALKSRVEILEAALGKLLDRTMINLSEDEEVKSKPAAFYSGRTGIMLGCSIDPIDFMTDPTRGSIGKEFSMLQCPKASIPTKERIETQYGPLINFKAADEFQMFCRQHSVDLKDGPYINLQNPRHDVAMKYQHLINWINERLSRPGADSPFYIDLVSNFLDEEGRIWNNSIFDKVGLIAGIYGMSEVVSAAAPDSSVGISFDFSEITHVTLSARLRSAADFITKVLESGVPLQYVGLKLHIDVSQRIDPNVMAINLDVLDQTGIPEIHITDLLITNKNDTPDGFPSVIYRDLVELISENELISVIGFGSPRSLPGYCEGLFDERMRRTSSYEAVRRSFWKISRDI